MGPMSQYKRRNRRLRRAKGPSLRVPPWVRIVKNIISCTWRGPKRTLCWMAVQEASWEPLGALFGPLPAPSWGSRLAQIGSKTPQDGPRSAQESPKTAPRYLGRPQDVQKLLPTATGRPQDGPKRLHDGRKTPRSAYARNSRRLDWKNTAARQPRTPPEMGANEQQSTAQPFHFWTGTGGPNIALGIQNVAPNRPNESFQTALQQA